MLDEASLALVQELCDNKRRVIDARMWLIGSYGIFGTLMATYTHTLNLDTFYITVRYCVQGIYGI